MLDTHESQGSSHSSESDENALHSRLPDEERRRLIRRLAVAATIIPVAAVLVGSKKARADWGT